ncbi:MAG: epoxyqueuosine reductase QueH [Mycoplasmatales bacterium]
MNNFIKEYKNNLKQDQKANYQIPLMEICKYYEENNIRPKVLIHACCAICSSTGLDILNKTMDVFVLFYNPNIHPHKEYIKRSNAQKKVISEYNKKYNSNMIFLESEYIPRDFFNKTKGLELEKEGTGLRCRVCYEMRMDIAAQKAIEIGADFFCTSLTLSPMKSSAIVNEIGFNLEEKYNITYLASDFKKNGGGLKVSELEKEFNIYRQSYCGCVYGAKMQGIKINNID